MAEFESVPRMSRLMAVVNVLGRPFMSLSCVANMVYSFVCGERDNIVHDKSEANLAIGGENGSMERTSFAQFSAFVDNLDFLYPDIFKRSGQFKQLNDFCVEQGIPFSAVLVSNRQLCRFCNRQLTVSKRHKGVIVYHLMRVTFLGCRFTKQCATCKVQEHYRHYKKEGKRVFDSDCLQYEYLLSSEETAIDMQMMKYLDQEVVQGAFPFLLKAKVYNSVHGYANFDENEKSHVAEDGLLKKRRRSVLYLCKMITINY